MTLMMGKTTTKSLNESQIMNKKSKKLYSSEFIIWQNNLQHCKLATDVILKDISKAQKSPVLLVQEPHIYRAKPRFNPPNYNVFFGKSSCARSLIAVPRGLRCWAMESLCNRDVTTVLLEDFNGQKLIVVSAYLDIKDKNVINDTLEKVSSFSRDNNLPMLLVRV